jgi:hypothetical protein
MARLRVPDIWHIAYFDPKIRSKVAMEQSASWPIPAGAGAGFGYSFFYYSIELRPPDPAYDIWPPSWLSFIDPTGTVVKLERVTPPDVGLNVPADAAFARHVPPSAGGGYKEADGRRGELLGSYEIVVRGWLGGEKREAVPRAATLRTLLQEAIAPALLPCYRHLGPSFFAWLGL